MCYGVQCNQDTGFDCEYWSIIYMLSLYEIDEQLKESDVQSLETKYLGGFVRGQAIKFYKYPLRQFTVGNIDIGARCIWITFDDRITDKVLGMDILKDMTFLNRHKEKRLYFYNDGEDVVLI